jgi:hypothetical protein
VNYGATWPNAQLSSTVEPESMVGRKLLHGDGYDSPHSVGG